MISIAITTFNGEKYLQTQLDSILKQSLLPNEVVIVDDNSSDRTWKIICEFSEIAPFKVITIKNPSNLGYSHNFSKALSNCTSDIVFMCDQDDQWFTTKLETIFNHLKKNLNKDVVIHDLAFCNSELMLTGETKIKRISSLRSVYQSYVTGMATAVNMRFLKLCLPIPHQYFAHDCWIHLCAHYTKRKSVFPEVLALYRRHENNTTSDLLINNPNKISKLHNLRGLIKEKMNVDFDKSIKRHYLLLEWLKRNRKILASDFNVNVWSATMSLAHLNFKIILLKLISSVFKLASKLK